LRPRGDAIDAIIIFYELFHNTRHCETSVTAITPTAEQATERV
jgi:F0F1-type ATP synthase gamma subunit